MLMLLNDLLAFVEVGARREEFRPVAIACGKENAVMVYTHLHPIEILLVEDNGADAFHMKEVLAESTVANTVHTVLDGEQALNFLYRKAPYRYVPRPDLILLDLNLPKKDGREVLAEMKNDPELKSIPVVVVTTSESEEDISKRYNLCASCYITKPIGLDELFEVVKGIENFWFSIVRLPSRRRSEKADTGRRS